MNVLRRLFLLVIPVLLAACASGPKYAEVANTIPKVSPDNGRIYFYRNTTFGAAVQPQIRVNGESVGTSKAKGFFYLDAAPGNYEIVTTTEVERKLSLTIEKGQTRYVRFGVSFGFAVGHVYPELVDNGVGAQEIQECSFTGSTFAMAPAGSGGAAMASPAAATPPAAASTPGAALAAAAPDAAAAAGDPNALRKGDRLRFQDFDMYSGARIAEKVLQVTRLDDVSMELDDGLVRVDRLGRGPAETPVWEPTFAQSLPPKIEPGATWETTYRAGSPYFPPSKATMRVVGPEERPFGKVKLQVVRLKVSGYASKPLMPVASYGGESFSGDVLVDARTGLVVWTSIKTTNKLLASERRLVEVLR